MTQEVEESKSIFTSQKDSTSRITDQGPTADSLDRAENTVSQDGDTVVEVNEATFNNSRRASLNVQVQAESEVRSRAQSFFPEPDRPQNITLPSTPKLTNTSKHPRPDEKGSGRIGSNSEPPLKKPRPKLRPRTHTIDPDKVSTAFYANRAQPPSPLFFSHSVRQRPVLPASFSSAEAAAMLNKARDESAGGITTLKLARGSLSQSASSPPRAGTPGSRASTEMNSILLSPDVRGRQTGLQLLGNVGIIELLEQDDRPQFIIDVANSANFTPGGPLQIIFANASLRAYPSTLELVAGKPDLYVYLENFRLLVDVWRLTE